MNRTAFRPLRTRRIAALTPTRTVELSAVKPKTRATLSAVGAICVAFAATTAALGVPSDAAPELSAAQIADAPLVRGRYLVDGSEPRPPMLESRFSAEDASAAVAYLKSPAP